MGGYDSTRERVPRGNYSCIEGVDWFENHLTHGPIPPHEHNLLK